MRIKEIDKAKVGLAKRHHFVWKRKSSLWRCGFYHYSTPLFGKHTAKYPLLYYYYYKNRSAPVLSWSSPPSPAFLDLKCPEKRKRSFEVVAVTQCRYYPASTGKEFRRLKMAHRAA